MKPKLLNKTISFLKPIFKNILNRIKILPQSVIWKAENRDGKLTKPPHKPYGTMQKVTTHRLGQLTGHACVFKKTMTALEWSFQLTTHIVVLTLMTATVLIAGFRLRSIGGEINSIYIILLL